MTAIEVIEWKGGPYEAIVLAGKWKETEAATVYLAIQASGKMLENNNNSFLAEEDEIERARVLLKQLIVCVYKAFAKSAALRGDLKGKTTKRIDKFDKWNELNLETTCVPDSNGWKDTTKVRKICFSEAFSEAKGTENPKAPDPLLLLAKGASNWLKRHDIELLPACGDGSSTTDNSMGSTISSSEEVSKSEYSHVLSPAVKQPCVAEIVINDNMDEVDEPLSDDEYLMDA